MPGMRKLCCLRLNKPLVNLWRNTRLLRDSSNYFNQVYWIFLWGRFGWIERITRPDNFLWCEGIFFWISSQTRKNGIQTDVVFSCFIMPERFALLSLGYETDERGSARGGAPDSFRAPQRAGTNKPKVGYWKCCEESNDLASLFSTKQGCHFCKKELLASFLSVNCTQKGCQI